MSSKAPKTVFVCSSCGAQFLKQQGRCTQCGEWNSLVEERPTKPSVKGARSFSVAESEARKPRPVSAIEATATERWSTGLGELDRVLGGGLTPGGVVLVGGDPGIGKSTLLLQALAGLAERGRTVLYATGEESASQVASRAKRLMVKKIDHLQIQATTELEDVLEAVESVTPSVVVVDSIQTLRSTELESAAGSVGQLRETTARLVELTKRKHIALFLIGHVTKDGALAGPKVLEHLVDTVLSFEGDRTHAFRLVRTTKNRFGPAHEVGVFEMAQDGLREVPDPSALFLAERPAKAAGSVVVPTAEGSRPLLVEAQALVAPALYGAARRVATGLDAQRLAILLAVIERRAEVHVLDRDVFASIAGGARVDEPALDVPLAIAIVSSLRDKPVPQDLVAFGEIGLAGELRAVPRPGMRIQEARKLGFKRVVLPESNVSRLDKAEREGVEILAAKNISDALRFALDY